METHYNGDTRGQWGLCAINTSFFHHMLLENKWEEITEFATDADEELHEKKMECLWARLSELFATFIHALTTKTVRHRRICDNGFLPVFWEEVMNDEFFVDNLQATHTEIE